MKIFTLIMLFFCNYEVGAIYASNMRDDLLVDQTDQVIEELFLSASEEHCVDDWKIRLSLGSQIIDEVVKSASDEPGSAFFQGGLLKGLDQILKGLQSAIMQQAYTDDQCYFWRKTMLYYQSISFLDIVPPKRYVQFGDILLPYAIACHIGCEEKDLFFDCKVYESIGNYFIFMSKTKYAKAFFDISVYLRCADVCGLRLYFDLLPSSKPYSYIWAIASIYDEGPRFPKTAQNNKNIEDAVGELFSDIYKGKCNNSVFSLFRVGSNRHNNDHLEASISLESFAHLKGSPFAGERDDVDVTPKPDKEDSHE